MRNWIKYHLDYSTVNVVNRPQEYTLPGQTNEMGYDKGGLEYENTDNFFQKYFYSYHSGRLLNYDKFLRKHIKKSYKVLSIASGRSANELKLLEDGYNVTCSDIVKLPSYECTKKLFPEYKFFTLDILKQPSDRKYDCLLSLSFIYLFNDEQLDIFFHNLSKSCKKNGYLILDSAGSPDNLLSYFIHDIIVKYETSLTRLFRNMFKKKMPFDHSIFRL